MDVRKLEVEAAAAKSLLANIRTVIGDDEDAVHDAIEGETGLIEAITAADQRMAEIDAMAEGFDLAMQSLKKRAERLGRQRECLRAAVLNAMAEAGLKKLELPTGTLSLSASPAAVEIVSEADLPSNYLVEKVEIKPDKKAILAALKDGTVIPGATLRNGAPRLNIRRA